MKILTVIGRISITLLIAMASTTSAAMVSEPMVFSDFDEAGLRAGGERQIVPDSYRAIQLDWAALDALLERTPLEAVNDPRPATVMALPLPNGDFGRFEIVESPIMEKGLADRYPELRTFRGQGIDDPAASLRFDTTPQGFHAAILSPAGRVFIDPYRRGDTDHYISYFTRDHRYAGGDELSCGFSDEERGSNVTGGGPLTAGDTLRTYRLAVAATAEYTAFHSVGSPTVAEGLAAIVTAINRVTGIYEVEVAIRMQLIANNDQIVYDDALNDPYTNNSGGAMLGENQANLDAVIGDANYDIGHVFSTGGGGIASLEVPCKTGSKARGVTGLGSPIGDVFWVDYVAHEMGHQWGGRHTFNGNSGACNGNRSASAAYEPGSGSTIQAYAGICGAHNIQGNSDAYFHGISFDEIVGYSTLGTGATCASETATGNQPPTVAAGQTHTIPVSTPFELCLFASDPDGHSLTRNWEQFDLGPAGHPNDPVGDAPIFRSFPAQLGCRLFPQKSDLIANTQTIGEILPTYARTLHFRMTARDNQSGGGGVAYDQGTVVEVDEASGPFLVTSPNTAVVWDAGTTETVTWDVAGTNLPPVDCPLVDILVSVDGGDTYQHEVASFTPNDGAEEVFVPVSIPETTQARLLVICTDNIFFDISNVDFEIVLSPEIFADGFESGDTSLWDATSP